MSDEKRHVHRLSTDAPLDERGGVEHSYDGLVVRCPNCSERNILPFIVDHGECIQCKMVMTAYIGYEDENDE